MLGLSPIGMVWLSLLILINQSFEKLQRALSWFCWACYWSKINGFPPILSTNYCHLVHIKTHTKSLVITRRQFDEIKLLKMPKTTCKIMNALLHSSKDNPCFQYFCTENSNMGDIATRYKFVIGSSWFAMDG